jgi:ubiquinone/menaquinone biosynthesis C-methylase UbiE
MNASHSGVTDWGLGQLVIGNQRAILDVGCGGGRTLTKLAGLAPHANVYGVDHSDASIAASTKTNAALVALGRVQVQTASVSRLPFPDGMFDLVTAVETHFWWPDPPGDMAEVFRLTRPGGQVALIAEVYRGANTAVSRLLEQREARTGLLMLSAPEHRALLADAGFADVQVIEERSKGWICAVGSRPGAR